MKLKNKMPIITNILSIAMGYVLSQNNLMFTKIAVCVSFIMWVFMYSQLDKE